MALATALTVWAATKLSRAERGSNQGDFSVGVVLSQIVFLILNLNVQRGTSY